MRRAASTEHSTRAAAWLTVHWVECHLLYGKASGRLAGVGVAISSASIRSGKAASGLVAATAFIRAQSPAMSARCSAVVRPSAARRALSIMAYCWTGSHSRWATSTGSSRGPARRCTTSGTAPDWAVSLGRQSGPFPVPCPALGLASDDDGDVGAAGQDGRQGIVDHALLGDPELGVVRGGRGRPDPVGHQAGRVGIGPAPLGHGHPVDGRGQARGPRRRPARLRWRGPSAPPPRHRPRRCPRRPAPGCGGRAGRNAPRRVTDPPRPAPGTCPPDGSAASGRARATSPRRRRGRRASARARSGTS